MNDNNNEDRYYYQERKEIEEEANKVNANIEEDNAEEANNQIKVKKHHPVVLMIVLVLAIALALFVAFMFTHFTKKVVEYENETTTTTIKKVVNKVENYLSKDNKVRKFENNAYILLLSPKGYDLINNESFYFFITKGMSNVQSVNYGTYSINNDKLILTTNNIKESLEINQNGIMYKNSLLSIFDSEYKSYYINNNDLSELIIINGTPKFEYSMYIQSNKENTTINTYTYSENQESIILNNSIVFNKDGMNIISKDSGNIMSILY